MNDFVTFNKKIGVYWFKSPIEKLLVKIKTKPLEGVQLPKFEQYNNLEQAQIFEKGTEEEQTFKWQEKVFSRHEIEKYSNVHNCLTDNELAYFEKLENTPCEGKKIFTYINEDYVLPLPFETRKEKKVDIPNLNSYFEKLNLGCADKPDRVFNDGSISLAHLFRSSENIAEETEQWMVMHIVYDNSEYNEDSQLLFKQETILFSMYYNTTKNFIILAPDSNDIVVNPYLMDCNGKTSPMQYAVEIDYGVEDKGKELEILLNKLHKKWEKKHKSLMNFSVPPLGKKYVHITFEIVSAEGFEMDNIYIDFHIKIPEAIQCADGNTHQGKTHTTSALSTEGVQRWKYGHIVDLEVEYTTGVEPPPTKVYLEVISTDWWGRHRTEGYTRLQIAMDPGWYSRNLSCTRPEELDVVEAESRRFFVGGCNLIKDMEVLDSQLQNSSLRFVTTGSVAVRWGIVRVKGAADRVMSGAASGAESGADGGALKAADAALRRYRRARALLAAAIQ